jgi:hypothetical protein|tara:strand:- start:726 stop:902 length:177 start_codon:yes stop_codon:yes gene_type:complete
MDPDNIPQFEVASHFLTMAAVTQEQKNVQAMCEWWLDEINSLEVSFTLKADRIPEIEL